MNANTAFYLQHTAIRFQADGAIYRAIQVAGRVRIFGEYSLAESFNSRALAVAQGLFS